MNAEGRWESITPQKAEAWINKHNTNNRKLRQGVVEKYAADMREGNWLPNPQPIIFFDDDVLADGQHRLWAVIESGATIKMYVVRGADRSIALNIDTGAGRSLIDNAKLAGAGDGLSNALLSMVCLMKFSHHQGKTKAGKARALSNSERLEILEEYSIPLRWSYEHNPRKRYVGVAAISVAVARAYLHEKDFERLAEFYKVLNTGVVIYGTEDNAALALRAHVVTGVQKGLRVDSTDLFFKAQNAIWHFMRRKSLSMIKAVKAEPYPLKKLK